MRISGWGRYPITDSLLYYPKTRMDCINLINKNTLIPRGNGRSYGDSANAEIVLQSNYFNKFIKFDPYIGIITCEAGVTISEILEVIVPKGWFIPVSTGTAFVTIGGAIASDVHGKNHHNNGTFSQHISSIELMIGSGDILTISPTQHQDLFYATCGGMGLTGIILAATIQLKSIKSSFIEQITIKTNTLEEVCDKFDQYKKTSYSVAWVDCLAKGNQLGRSLLFLGEHLNQGQLSLNKKNKSNILSFLPSFLLNKYTVRVFNELYFKKTTFSKDHRILSFEKYFYPLDTIPNWNLMYGKKGFIQYQCVLPKIVGVQGLKKLIRVISDNNMHPFLAVLKIFGEKNKNYLSFPMPGYSLALDFKMSQSIFNLVKILDSFISDMGGKIYLTKDALMTEETFKKTYPQWQQFEVVRQKYGAIGKFASAQSKRLGLA
jgi:decaprenylphospho-beta-D-ribofuranose 2-oxidase